MFCRIYTPEKYFFLPIQSKLLIFRFRETDGGNVFAKLNCFFFLKKQLYRFNPLIELSAMQKTVSCWKRGRKKGRDTFLLFLGQHFCVELFRLITNNLFRVCFIPQPKRSSDDTHRHHATKYTPANRQMTNLGRLLRFQYHYTKISTGGLACSSFTYIVTKYIVPIEFMT